MDQLDQLEISIHLQHLLLLEPWIMSDHWVQKGYQSYSAKVINKQCTQRRDLSANHQPDSFPVSHLEEKLFFSLMSYLEFHLVQGSLHSWQIKNLSTWQWNTVHTLRLFIICSGHLSWRCYVLNLTIVSVYFFYKQLSGCEIGLTFCTQKNADCNMEAQIRKRVISKTVYACEYIIKISSQASQAHTKAA